MKKLILILALVPTLLNAQCPVKVTNVTDTVYQLDTLRIKFMVGSCIPSSTVRIQLWNAGGYLQYCLDITNAVYQSTYNVAVDTQILKVKIIAPMLWGNSRIYSNNTTPYKSFYIKKLPTPIDTTTISPIDTYIPKYDKESVIIKETYYDILGKEIDLNYNGLIIKITTFSNGYQRKEKIIKG